MTGEPGGTSVAGDTLLVPIDGSDGAERAMAHALALASATGAAIHVLHVVDARGPLGALGARLDPEVGRDRGQSLLRTAADLAEAAGVPVTTELAEGPAHDAILDRAAEDGCALTVMGRRGDPGTTARLLGGVTDKVLRGADRPVLVVPAADRTDPEGIAYERLLLPTDGSEHSLAAAGPAADLAGLLGAAVHVVTAVAVDGPSDILDDDAARAALIEDLEGRAGDATAEAAARISPDGSLRVETAVVRGRPHRALATYVADEDIDLVAMGSRGRSGVSRRLLGSVTDRLLRSVDVPVLVVPDAE